MRMSRKLLDEVRGYENICMCIRLAILQGIERMFPGLYGLLKIRSLITYSLPLDEINDLKVIVKLLNETFNDKELLKNTVKYLLSRLAERPEDIVGALLSEDEDRLYIALSRLNDPTFWSNCRKLLR